MAVDADALLDQLFVDPPPGSPPEQVSRPASGLKPAIAKINYSHSAMIDLILAEPGISQNEIAARFGYSASWISTIMATDAFQTAFAERSAEIIDPSLKATVEERFKGLVLRSIEILQHKLAKPPDQVPDELALRTFQAASKAAGYGARDSSIHVTQNVHNHLEVLGTNLTQLLRKKKTEAQENFDAQIVAEAPAASGK